MLLSCFNCFVSCLLIGCRELKIALELNGVSATEDMAMVAQIKAEVRKLSNRNDIYNSICVLEKEEQLEENTKRMIYISETPRSAQAKVRGIITNYQAHVSKIYTYADMKNILRGDVD